MIRRFLSWLIGPSPTERRAEAFQALCDARRRGDTRDIRKATDALREATHAELRGCR